LATKRWKLEYYMEEDTGRLFDRMKDPEEQSDLYSSPDHREIRDAMRHALLSWRSDIMDVNFLVTKTTGGGPVARRIAPHSKAIRGTDAEERLNRKVEDLGLS
jgi:hypothetical protein